MFAPWFGRLLRCPPSHPLSFDGRYLHFFMAAFSCGCIMWTYQAVLSRAELLLSSGCSDQPALDAVVSAMESAVAAWSRVAAEEAEKRAKEAEILKYKTQEHVVRASCRAVILVRVLLGMTVETAVFFPPSWAWCPVVRARGSIRGCGWHGCALPAVGVRFVTLGCGRKRFHDVKRLICVGLLGCRRFKGHRHVEGWFLWLKTFRMKKKSKSYPGEDHLNASNTLIFY